MKPRSSVRADALLKEGATAHYREPAYYTKSYQRRVHDVAFYVKLASQTRGRVLEYGCGNGRITLPIAMIGCEITGVDQSPQMLADLRNRIMKAPPEVRDRIRVVHGDMRTVRLRDRFSLVLCTFNTFLHLYTRNDAERFLACARRHLGSGGNLVFDISVPSPSELARDPTRGYRVPPMRYPLTGELVRYAEFFDYDPARQVLLVTMQFEPIDAPQRAWTTLLAHRQYHPQEIEALLHYNGFEMESITSDFTAQPLHRYADAAVITARLRPARHSGIAKQPTR